MSMSAPIYEAEFSMSTPTRFIVPSEFSMSTPILEAEMSMPVLGKARKLTSRRLTESMSMSAPIYESEFSMSSPIFEAEFSASMSL